MTTFPVPRASMILGHDVRPNLSHQQLGHCNSSSKQPVTTLSHHHPLGQQQTACFSLQSHCPNLSPLRGRCASSPRPPHLPDQGPTQNDKNDTTTERRTTMTTANQTPGHDTTTANAEVIDAAANAIARADGYAEWDRLLPETQERFRHWAQAALSAAVLAERDLIACELEAVSSTCRPQIREALLTEAARIRGDR